jgi:Glycosyltransferase family 87
VTGARGRRLRPHLVGLVVLVVVAAAVATERASHQRIGTDFHVFWQAGYDFAHGLPLYQRLPGARLFLYPPFAAQVFQGLSLFPLKVAAWLFYVASVCLVVVAVGLSRDIVRRLDPTRGSARLPLALAVVFSANFILNNLNMLQVNLLIFVLCLLGIRAFAQQREVAGSGWVVAATAMKLTPVFFVFWALIRGTRRSLAGVAGFGLLCVILPMIQRGFHPGLTDLTTYYQTFLHQFASGRVIAHYTNQNLAAMVYRAVVPGTGGQGETYNYVYLPSLETAAPLIYQVAALVVLAAFLAHLVSLRVRHRPFSALEISSVFLASHLLSGLTWKAHLVTLLFVFYAFFVLDPRDLGRGGRVALGLAWAGIVAIGIGRDLMGDRLHHYVGGYSVIVWVMLLLFALSVVWSQRKTSEVRGEESSSSRPSDQRAPCSTNGPGLLSPSD